VADVTPLPGGRDPAHSMRARKTRQERGDWGCNGTGVRSQKAVTKKGVPVKIPELAEAKYLR